MFLTGQDRYVQPEPILGERLHMPIYWIGEQWAVTSYGIEETTGKYAIPRKDFKTWDEFMMVYRHMSEKNWVYIGEFMSAGKAHFKLFGNKSYSRERAKLTRGIRFRVLQRDGFRCKYCGTNAEERPLHVDHIVPVSKGGKSSMNNLVTACDMCNLGKSSSVLEARHAEAN